MLVYVFVSQSDLPHIRITESPSAHVAKLL